MMQTMPITNTLDASKTFADLAAEAEHRIRIQPLLDDIWRVLSCTTQSLVLVIRDFAEGIAVEILDRDGKTISHQCLGIPWATARDEAMKVIPEHPLVSLSMVGDSEIYARSPY